MRRSGGLLPWRQPGTGVETKERSMEKHGTRDPIDRFFLVVVVILAIFLVSLGLAIYPH
jgi:hypothetical protein